MHQRRDPIRDGVDPIRLRLVDDAGKRQAIQQIRRVLESNDAREYTAVQFGQHDMHGEVGSTEPARAIDPGSALGSGDDGLQHRNASLVERRKLVRTARRSEGRRGDDQLRL